MKTHLLWVRFAISKGKYLNFHSVVVEVAAAAVVVEGGAITTAIVESLGNM